MNKEYGEQDTVEDLLSRLHTAMALIYKRSGLEIRMEPDAFYRFQQSLNGGSGNLISEYDYRQEEILLTTPVGRLRVIKDKSLGESSYFRRIANG